VANQKFNISFVIGAVDNVSLKVMQINERVQKAFAPLQKLSSSFGFLGAELGLKKIGSALGDVGTKGKAVFDNFVSAGLKLAAVAGTIGAAFRYVAVGAANSADQIKEASERLGVSTGMFQTLQYAATQSGVRLEKLEPLLTKLSVNLGTAGEEGSATGRILKTLGVNFLDSAGGVKSLDEILPGLADKLSAIENPALRNKIAVELFGKEGVKFAQVLQGGSKGLDDFRKRAESLGLVLGDDLVNDGAKVADQMEEVGLVFSRLRDAAGAELFPVLKQLLTQITEIFVANRPAIIAFAKSFAQDLPNILKSLVDIFKGVYAAIQPIIVVFGVLSKIFGTANLVIGILAVTITGKLIVSIYALMGALVKLGFIAAATPIGLIAIGIGLVIAAIAALIIYWEPIKNFFMGLFDMISQSPFALLLGPIGALIFLGRKLYENWEPIKQLFSDIGGAISGVAGRFANIFGIGGGGAAAGASGPALNATQTAVQAASAGSITNSTENRIAVDFNNLPQGTRIKTEKAEAPVDLSMGYAMVMP
jgi:hypothetical protein